MSPTDTARVLARFPSGSAEQIAADARFLEHMAKGGCVESWLLLEQIREDAA